MSTQQIIRGIFKEELKNRFFCLVEVVGVDTLCYIPSSCRLSNFIDLKGKTVLLTPNKSLNTRTQYSVHALFVNGQYVLLNMSTSNRIIEQNINSRRFSFLGKRRTVYKEHIIEGYKSDLYIEDTRTIVEIKSFLSFERSARFPSIYSERALNQLEKLSSLLSSGYNVCYLFASLNPCVKELCINEEVKGYYSLIQECIKKGMCMKALSLKMNEDCNVIIDSNIKIKG